MINTELSVEVSNGTNPKVMRLYDTSHYYVDQITENYIIEVLPVNKEKWVHFYVRPKFSLVLNSSNLLYNVVCNHEELIPLPDGIYEIKQSHKPNILTVNHFYHFRVTELMNNIGSERSKLYSDKCSLSKFEYIRHRDTLRDIQEYVNGAKWAVEECHDRQQGKEMYEFAKKQLEHYTNECQC